jgi:Na+/H+ antiporter NhaA
VLRAGVHSTLHGVVFAIFCPVNKSIELKLILL